MRPARSAVAALALALALVTMAGAAACTGGGHSAATQSSSPSAPAVAGAGSAPAPPQPTFADVQHGSTRSVVKLYSYDARARSAVLEPIVFMDGGEFCRKFKIKATDGRCELEYTTEDSHLKITVPVSRKPELMAWDDGKGGDCIGLMTTGGVCPTSPSAFARWLKENPAGYAVITTENGTVTRLAEMYTP